MKIFRRIVICAGFAGFCCFSENNLYYCLVFLTLNKSVKTIMDLFKINIISIWYLIYSGKLSLFFKQKQSNLFFTKYAVWSLLKAVQFVRSYSRANALKLFFKETTALILNNSRLRFNQTWQYNVWVFMWFSW